MSIEKKSEFLQIRLTPSEKNKIQEYADRYSMKMSEFLLYGALKVITETEFYNNQMKK